MRHGVKAVIAASLLCGAVAAQPAPDRDRELQSFWRGTPLDIGQRNVIAKERVDRAAEAGRLDPREAARVNAQLYEVRAWVRQTRAAHRDGVLTPAERERIFARQDQVVLQIHWLTRNGR